MHSYLHSTSPLVNVKNECKRTINSQKITDTPKAVAESITGFIKVLTSIDTESPVAKLNETTISDNNGGRIEL